MAETTTAHLAPTRRGGLPLTLVPLGLLLVTALLSASVMVQRSGQRPRLRSVDAVSARARPADASPSSPVTTPPSTTTTVLGTVVAATPPPTEPVTTTCADASAYLAAHAAPGFEITCAPGSALGHYGYTCVNVPDRCEGKRLIRIACPAPFVYKNEATNSWTLTGTGKGIDPFGSGSPAEQAFCDRLR